MTNLREEGSALMTNPGHIELHVSQSTYYLLNAAAKVSGLTLEEFIMASATNAAKSWAENS